MLASPQHFGLTAAIKQLPFVRPVAHRRKLRVCIDECVEDVSTEELAETRVVRAVLARHRSPHQDKSWLI